MPKMYLIILLFLLLIILAFGYYIFFKKDNGGTEIKCVKINNLIIRVDIADNVFKRSKGLGGRVGLADDQGMFFIFPTYAKQSFWMKDMNFAIDIIWIKDKEIVDISKNISPASYPQTYQPQAPVNYVLEVNAGFCDKNNITIGQRVDYSDC